MSLHLVPRMSAAAGLVALTAAATAGTPPVVHMPLNGSTTTPVGYTTSGYNSGYTTGGFSDGYMQYGGTVNGPNVYYHPLPTYPVERLPVQYLRYHPTQWYGLPGSMLPQVAPQVYMPTDTTQQGFYYQRVPTWQPVPGMFPPAPNPAMYNTYIPGGAIGMPYSTGQSTYDGASYSSSPTVASTPASTSGNQPAVVKPLRNDPVAPAYVAPEYVAPKQIQPERLPLMPPAAPIAE